jgi:hypothetical protein
MSINARHAAVTSPRPFVGGPDPVTDLAGDSELIGNETGSTEEAIARPERSAAEALLVRHHTGEPCPFDILGRSFDPRHPSTDPVSFFFDRLPELIEVAQLVAPKHHAIAQVDGERTHRWDRHS